MKTDRRTSGIAALDSLLGGGLETRTITQIYGEPASGKSTLCMLAAVSCLRAGHPVVYIDSEGFSIERFRQIAGKDTERIAEHLFLFEPLDFEHQGTMIAEAEKVLKAQKPGLLVMDSATALYRTDLEKGRDALQAPTKQMIHLLGLRLGHLAGNRFAIRIRGSVADGVARAAAVIEVLKRRGVPNYFGAQRFGTQANSHLVGRAWVLGDYQSAVDLLIGSGEGITDEQWRSAIAAYRDGDLERSVRLFPPHCRTEREIVQRLAKKPDNWRQSLGGVPPRLKSLYVSAFQSHLFNLVLDERLERFDSVMTGDLAYKHANGACFLVEDAAKEAERALCFEISPTGPMLGGRMKLPQGEPLALEDEVLHREGVDRSSLSASALLPDGERRPLRVPLGAPEFAADGEGLFLTFSLPRGAYATAVLREIIKSDGVSLS